MYATQLVQLLNKGSVVADNLRYTVSLCKMWYDAEPSLTPFVLHAIFADLAARGWDDQQGVPYQPFQSGVLPHLLQIAGILSATPSAEPIGELDALIVSYRDLLRTIP